MFDHCSSKCTCIFFISCKKNSPSDIKTIHHRAQHRLPFLGLAGGRKSRWGACAGLPSPPRSSLLQSFEGGAPQKSSRLGKFFLRGAQTGASDFLERGGRAWRCQTQVTDARDEAQFRCIHPKKEKKLLPTAVDLNGFQFKFRSHCTPPLLSPPNSRFSPRDRTIAH